MAKTTTTGTNNNTRGNSAAPLPTVVEGGINANDDRPTAGIVGFGPTEPTSSVPMEVSPEAPSAAASRSPEIPSKKKNNGAAAPEPGKGNTEPDNIFTDLKGLRKRTKTIDVSESADVVDYRKPKRQEFFRINPDPDLTIEADIFTDENDDDAPHFVDPDARHLFDADDLKRVNIVVCINQFDVVFLWGVPIIDEGGGGRGLAYNLTAKKAAGMALEQWVRMRSIRRQRAYKIIPAEDEGEAYGEPKWPANLSLGDLLWKAFNPDFSNRVGASGPRI
jgi:hypothetical protein